jgi:hypothetical protein
MVSAAWIVAAAAAWIIEIARHQRRVKDIRWLIGTYENATRPVDARPIPHKLVAARLRELMARHDIQDARFSAAMFSRLEQDAILSQAVLETEPAVQAKLRIVLYRIYGAEEAARDAVLSVDSVAEHLCAGPVGLLAAIWPSASWLRSKLITACSWLAVLYALLLAHVV